MTMSQSTVDEDSVNGLMINNLYAMATAVTRTLTQLWYTTMGNVGQTLHYHHQDTT